MRKAKIALTIGDSTGIGPEIIAKVLADKQIKDHADFVVVGDKRMLEMGMKIAKVDVPYEAFTDADEALAYKGDKYPLIDRNNLNLTMEDLGKRSAESGKATGDDLQFSIDLAKAGKIDGIVYAPINKAAMYDGGYHFEDELRYFAHALEYKGVVGEINTIGSLWTARIASHVPMKEVYKMITKENIKNVIRLTYKTLKEAGYENPRIGVNGFNPHCGDNGLCGDEEGRVIAPAIEECKAEGINVKGPYSADTVFLAAQKGEMDLIIGMYHDQIQVGIKLLGFQRGVSISAGLPVVLTTPAHGTAFDIVGKGIADPGPMKHAIMLGAKMAVSRLKENN
ncbi:MAG: PdxA family dehydrogenase [Acetivibrionales bacterium]|jgi:4-hydroxythreonine-4-phosphate dehydrogenase